MAIKLENKELSEELKRINKFFDYKRSRVMSVAAIEEVAVIPKNTLLNFLKIGRPLPQKHILKIIEVLTHFGYESKYDWSWINSKYS